MSGVTLTESIARFVIRGTQPTTVDVYGTLNVSAAVGLEAVIAALGRELDVVIDLTQADAVDEFGWRSVNWAISEIQDNGGTAAVRLSSIQPVG
jgi:hypothetical protein